MHRRWSLLRLSLGAFVSAYLCIRISGVGSSGASNQTSEPPLVTFIIPSKGRESLRSTVSSLVAQQDSNWRAIIVFNVNSIVTVFRSTVNCPAFARDSRVLCTEHVSSLRNNCAGTVRNHGISLAETSWIAFVDDDDTVAR